MLMEPSAKPEFLVEDIMPERDRFIGVVGVVVVVWFLCCWLCVWVMFQMELDLFCGMFFRCFGRCTNERDDFFVNGYLIDLTLKLSWRMLINKQRNNHYNRYKPKE